jgi:putative heme transporter
VSGPDRLQAPSGDGAPSGDQAQSGGGRRWWRSPIVRVLIGVALVGVVIAVILQAGSIESDLSRTLSHLSAATLPWLLLGVLAEAVSFSCYASVQRGLLRTGGARLSRRSMIALAVGSTGLTNLVPGGVAPAGGWLVGQYRRRGIPMPLALWSVLAGGVTATVTVLALLLIGTGIAGLVAPLWLVLGALLVVGVTTALVLATHRLPVVEQWVARHRRLQHNRMVRTALSHATTAGEFRATVRGGTHAYAFSLGNWLMDVVVLISAFLTLGLPVPWRGLLFAYTLAQVAGSLTPLPGGIGVVEGGMVGAFAVTGTPVGSAFLATIIYRAITSWSVAAVGSIVLIVISRRDPGERASLDGAAARLDHGRGRTEGAASAGAGGTSGSCHRAEATPEERRRG